MQYRREIDGLRSVAVIPVILFHAGFSMFSGGYVGVDVFFVISGYLITSIIAGEIEQGRFSIIGFYERRARRIVPALSLVMLCCVPPALFWMVPDQLRDFSDSLAAVSLFCSNILFWHRSGYFEAITIEKPLLHTWSLAVEEQYYLLFPLLLLAIHRWGRLGKIPVIVGLSLVSLLLSQWASGHVASANFYLAPTRAWELLTGSLCALILKDGAPRRNDLLATLGFALILYALFAFDENTPIPSLYALAPVGGAALIILFSGDGSWVTRVLSLKPFVGIGLISYSAYLWHQPLFAFARITGNAVPGGVVLLTLSLLSLVLAYGTWRYVERPFRNRQGFDRRAIFLFWGASSLFFVTIGAIGHSTHGFARIWAAHQPPKVAKAYAFWLQADKDHAADGMGRDIAPCIFNVNQVTDAAIERRIAQCHARYGKGIAILGDSHAIDLFGLVTARRDAEFPFIVAISQGGCRPHTPQPSCHYDGFLKFVAAHPETFEHIVFEQAGFYLLRSAKQTVGSRTMLIDIPLNEPVRGIFANTEFIERDVAYLEKLASYGNVTWFGPRFEPQISNVDFVRNGCDYRYSARPGQYALYDNLDAHIARRLRGTSIKYLSQTKAFHIDVGTDFMNCDRTLWSDGDHFSRAGQAYFAQRFDLLRALH